MPCAVNMDYFNARWSFWQYLSMSSQFDWILRNHTWCCWVQWYQELWRWNTALLHTLHCVDCANLNLNASVTSFFVDANRLSHHVKVTQQQQQHAINRPCTWDSLTTCFHLKTWELVKNRIKSVLIYTCYKWRSRKKTGSCGMKVVKGNGMK